jgi:predicted RNA-binding Zn-ribbon protein involved in translation (DUF1610 family)
MSTLLSRIMLAIFMLPSAALVGFIASVVTHELRIVGYPYRNRSAWIAGALATWIFVGIYWLLLWRKAVRWTTVRKRLTLLAAGGAAIVAAICGLATRFVDDDFGFFVFTSVTVLVWLPVTVLIWRETPAERADRLRGTESALSCPVCGYNLTGLSVARCPECGNTFTLDELMRDQASRESRELIRES